MLFSTGFGIEYFGIQSTSSYALDVFNFGIAKAVPNLLPDLFNLGITNFLDGSPFAHETPYLTKKDTG